ncbi:GNAT family N-acetyltransferase [Streptomyces subrutilus]|uniref:GNAT family N-acetyltransferase n=1 Tax=Streptomyces subrutilus TaxID=36818 RepID=UPI0033ED06E1
MDRYVVRAVRAEEWRKVKELRIAALQDPVAPVAFLETLEQAAGRGDAFWQDRARVASQGRVVRQFVAEGPDGQWVGSVTLLVEAGGSVDFLERPIERTQGHMVGVFVRDGYRGAGVADGLFRAALEWAWSLEEPVLERVRLFVHRDNPRAAAFYRRFGFVATGTVLAVPAAPSATEREYAYARP